MAIRLSFAIIVSLVIAVGAILNGQSPGKGKDSTDRDDRLTFQTHAPWSPRINLNADVAMVYGIGPQLPAMMDTWRTRGYRMQVMTGVAWGQYQDYLNGEFDGKKHWDQAQMDKDGKLIQHGPTVPYISPGSSYGTYLTKGVKNAIDAGAEAIYLEEPEFWARGGYEDNFKREWKDYYHEDWQRPDSSPDAQYRASKLKYFLYRRALSQVFDFVKDYSKEHGRTVHCYVPTHSLINYAHWRIVSPESSLIDVGADGYIAQVWTGTSRTPNVYEGRRAERTFETAFLEYGAMQNLVRASGRRVWYLNDPIEDNPNHSWTDYRTNWENTLTASLLQPAVSSYEIMPWPERIFNGKRPVSDSPGERSGIPAAYATELQAVIRALGEMKQPENKVHWERSGTPSVGVLVSDSMMFQRSGPSPSDENLGSFYGLALPMLINGIPVEPVQMESAEEANFLSRYKMLWLTYEGQKPRSPKLHSALAAWVRKGGILVVVDNDQDPYLAVREWWNTAPNSYKTPRQHFFEALRLGAGQVGANRVGKGMLWYERASPAALSYENDGAAKLRSVATRCATMMHLPWKESGALVLRRGPYLIAAALREQATNKLPVILKGRYVNLFDSNLSVLTDVKLQAGQRALLYDLNAAPARRPSVVAAACRVRDEQWNGSVLRFSAEGIGSTQAAVRLSGISAIQSVSVGGKQLNPSDFDASNGTFLLRFANSSDPVQVEIRM